MTHPVRHACGRSGSLGSAAVSGLSGAIGLLGRFGLSGTIGLLGRFGLAAIAALLLAPAAAQAQAGLLLGTVKDRDGTAVAGATVELEGSSHRVITGDEGRFRFDSVLAGAYVLRVAREGFREARAEVRIPADSAVMVDIILESEGQRLGEVVVTERQRNRVYGVVLGPADRPRRDTRVAIIGLGRAMMTDQDGVFSFADLPDGEYLLEVREEGYELERYSVRMVAGIERAVTLRLRPGRDALTKRDVENAAIAEREAASRESLRRRSATVVLGREELARHGKMGLDWALQQAAPNLFRVEQASGYCVLVDGLQPFGPGQSGGDVATRATGMTYFPQALSRPGARLDNGWLRAFFADQVERVELFPGNTDDSRTLCARFSQASGCGCGGVGGNAPTVVVWLRR